MTAIARLGTIVLDCPDPAALAAFYGGIIEWPIEEGSDDDWIELVGPDVSLAFQRVDDYAAPAWPGNERPQQAHLDFYVPDLDEGETLVLALGAVAADHQPGITFRVYLDPANHPFCLCLDS